MKNQSRIRKTGFFSFLLLKQRITAALASDKSRFVCSLLDGFFFICFTPKWLYPGDREVIGAEERSGNAAKNNKNDIFPGVKVTIPFYKSALKLWRKVEFFPSKSPHYRNCAPRAYGFYDPYDNENISETALFSTHFFFFFLFRSSYNIFYTSYIAVYYVYIYGIRVEQQYYKRSGVLFCFAIFVTQKRAGRKYNIIRATNGRRPPSI